MADTESLPPTATISTIISSSKQGIQDKILWAEKELLYSKKRVLELENLISNLKQQDQQQAGPHRIKQEEEGINDAVKVCRDDGISHYKRLKQKELRQRQQRQQRILQRLQGEEEEDDDEDEFYDCDDGRSRNDENDENYGHSNDDTSTNNTKSLALFVLQGETLQLVLEWLCPIDILSCIQVCQRWKYDMDDVDHNLNRRQLVWSKALENEMNQSSTTPPNQSSKLLDDIAQRIVLLDKNKHKHKKQSVGVITSPSQPRPIIADYKQIAKGLVYKPEQPPKPKTLPNILNDRQVLARAKRIHILFEVKDSNTGKVFGCWDQTLNKFQCQGAVDDGLEMINNDSQKVSIPETIIAKALAEAAEEANDDNSREDDSDEAEEPSVPDQDERIISSICNNIVVTARTFRCDTFKSLCWVYEQHPIRDTDEDNQAYLNSGFLMIPDLTTRSGLRAAAIWESKKYMSMSMEITLHFKKKQQPTNNNENNTKDSDKREGDKGEKEIPEYYLDQLYCDFGNNLAQGTMNERQTETIFVDMRELLFSLEGLKDWR